MSEPELVDFANPPVVEAVIATEFPAVPELDTVKLLEIQRSWAHEYPVLELKDLLPPMSSEGPMLRMSTEPELRVWASNPNNGQLVQMQSNRLVLNWRGGIVDPQVLYPRFEHLKNEYERVRGSIAGFTVSGSLPSPTVVEFAYVNRVKLDEAEGIENFLKWSANTGPGARISDEFRVVRSVSSEGFPERRLKLQARAGSEPSGDLMLHLSIEVRSVVGPAYIDWMSVVDRCRRDARLMFQQITTTEAHDRWGRNA